VVGEVVSDKMAKTVAVKVVRRVRHRKYGKYVARTTVYKAHDERETAKQGDIVEIAEGRPISRTKHWRLVRVVGSARVVAVRGEEEIASLAPPEPARGAGADEAGRPSDAAEEPSS
jgi:small subunit ribosomal protein S17